jgi:hypothetical protein
MPLDTNSPKHYINTLVYTGPQRFQVILVAGDAHEKDLHAVAKA